jgi:Flp pilus assembly protein TadG
MKTRLNLRRDERGAALVEAPFAIVILLVFGMGAFWIGNVVTRYHELEDAVHAGSRYGSRAFAAPDTGARRRTAAQITAFTTSAAEPLTTVNVSVKCGTDPNALSACPNPEVMPPGTYLEVSASAPVATNDPVLALGRSINGLLSTIVPGSPRPFPQTITASESSVAVIE